MQNAFDRRRFVLALAGAAGIATLPRAVRAAMGPNDKFDLVIRNGDVLDPSRKLRGKRDIGIRNGLVEAVENSIPAERALRSIDAAGKLVTPGLIDLHAHTYPYGSARYASALRVDDFLKQIHVVSLDEPTLARLAPHVAAIAEAEGLAAHAESVRMRRSP